MPENASSQVDVKVNLDDSSFRQGMKNTQQNLQNTKQEAKSTKEDFQRLGTSLEQIGGTFRAIGLAAAGFIAGIAATAPSLAGTMARLKNEFFKFSNTIGESLKPGLDFLLDRFAGLNNFMQDHPLFADIIANGAVVAAVIGGIIGSLDLMLGSVLRLSKNIPIAIQALEGLAGVSLGTLLLEFGAAAVAVGVLIALVYAAKKAAEALVNQFSPENGVTPPPELGYKFAPGTRTIYDDAALGGSLKNQGLPSQTPERIFDPTTGEFRLKTRKDVEQDIINRAAQQVPINLNLNLDIQNSGSDRQKITRSYFLNPTIPG